MVQRELRANIPRMHTGDDPLCEMLRINRMMMSNCADELLRLLPVFGHAGANLVVFDCVVVGKVSLDDRLSNVME